MRQTGKRKGAVLIVVLGVLFILALLATTFAQLQATEKQVARNYLDGVRAKLIAQSGVQDADARLREYFPARYFESVTGGAPQAWKFWGQDSTEKIEPTNVTGKIEDAINPSFALEAKSAGVPETPQNPDDPNVAPLTVTIDGKARGMSGVMGSGTYARNGDHYVLKISDLSGRIYVNDGIDQGPSGSVSLNLKRMLNVLGDIVNVKDLGTNILANRPPGGYRHPQDLLKAVNYDDALYNRFKDFVTVFAWVDNTVCLPVPLSQNSLMLDMYGSAQHGKVTYYRGTPPVYRMGSSKDVAGKEAVPTGGLMTCPTACVGGAHDNTSIRIYGLDVLNPQWIEIVSRAPVNVNTAAKEVLVALLTDLRGWYVADRRRNNPRWEGELYLSFKQQNTLSPDRNEGDEYGFLMETVPIVGPGGTGANTISAFDLADEVIGCRNRSATKNFNYADPKYKWTGPFKSWYQFDQFVDNLVAIGVIVDNRDCHVDYPQSTSDPTGYGTPVMSTIQQKQAAKAAADVIKSNFNPNLHLNELNPDHNTYRLVDKTDLFVNSTEFNFLPTGHFEVEALGRVVRGAGGVPDIFLAGNHELVAQAKVTATYKFYELYRETNQRQFYMGEASPTGSGFETNNGRSLEIGPEPDNGKPPFENEYGGYIQLPTIGSVFHSAPLKQKHQLMRTLQLPQSPQFNAAMHGHFTFDGDLHHHIVDPKELACRGYTPKGIPNLPDENVENHPDLGLNYPGPYDPTKGPGFPHRNGRSFRLPPKGQGGPSATMPLLPKFAPSDLRIDGLYSERHCSPAYYVRSGANALWNFSQEKAQGMVSFWFKPSYFPELTGKVRQVWDLGRFHRPCGADVYVWPFQMVFLPSHTNPLVAETKGPRYWSNNMGEFQPASFYWGSKQWHGDEVTPIDGSHSGHQFGKITKSLNHIGHGCTYENAGNANVMIGHRWVHTTVAWTLPASWDGNAALSKMWLNGRPIDGTTGYSYTTMTTWAEGYDKMWGFEMHAGGEYNHMRLGAPSKICNAAVVTNFPGVPGAYRGNHTADFTVDEFYVWKNETDSNPLTTWLRGRYKKPDPNYGEGKFTSQAISLAPATLRQPPPASTVVPSGAGGGPPPSMPAELPTIRVLGVAWSWYGEGLNANGLPALYDYASSTTGAPSNKDLEPLVRVTGIQDGAIFHPADPPLPGLPNDGFSRVRDGQKKNGESAEIQDPKQLKYVAQFSLNAAFGDILVVTPVLDDVTIYWDDKRSHLLSYVFDNRAF